MAEHMYTDVTPLVPQTGGGSPCCALRHTAEA